jgi:hypothetical protein
MSSSIFSSKKEIRVIMGVVFLLLVFENLARIVEVRLSKDVRHIREIPRIVERLRKAKPIRVLFLGNSLSRAGIDVETIRQTIQSQAGEGLTLERIIPDDTALCDWYYLYRRFLVNRHVTPDLVVVGYIGNQLEDHSQLHMDRLGGYFGGWTVLQEAFHYDIPGLEDRIRYLLSSMSHLFANQERIRNRMLKFFVPHYHDSAQVLNRATRRLAQKRQEQNQLTYQRLRRFINLVQANGTHMALVAMPSYHAYELPDTLVDTVAAEGALLLDLRYVEGLAKDDFPDRYHLSSRGAKAYSSALAMSLRKFGLL